MDFLHAILIKPFADMVATPDFLMQVLWEGRHDDHQFGFALAVTG